jgi:hypothetical protein
VGYNATYVVYKTLEERIPPMVNKLDSINLSADNKITMNEEIAVGVTRLLITFD